MTIDAKSEATLPPSEDRWEPQRLIRDHVGLAVAGGLAVLIALRVLVEARFDPVTAKDILASSATSAIPTTVILAVLPQALFLFLINRLLRLVQGRRGTVDWINSLTVFIVSAIFVPPGLLVIALITMAVYAIVMHFIRQWWNGLSTEERERRTGQGQPLPYERLWAVGPTLVGIAVFSAGPWLPTEVVRVNSEETVGYVLGERQGWVRVLRDTDRSVIQFKAADIQGRFVCDDSEGFGWFTETLVSLNSDRSPDYPECDDYGD